ncbi:MAG TPA: hypothetical protein VF697_26790, partial [Archangium sp.]
MYENTGAASPMARGGRTCALVLMIAATFVACHPDLPEPTPPPVDNPYGEVVAPKGTSFLVELQDVEGKPVPGAVVKAQGRKVTANEQGLVLLEELTPGRFVVQVEAPGFVPHARELELGTDAATATSIRLMPLGEPIRFDTTQPSQVQRGGVKVVLPAGALRDANGKPVTGEADMYIVPIDPTTEALRAAPGPLLGLSASGGEQVGLESFFMAEINIQQQGRPLQLAEGVKATLEFPIPAAIHDRAPVDSTIPAWWFDTQSGIWREEGAGLVTESEPGKRLWTVQVSHFTSWNADKPWNLTTCIKVKVVDSSGAPVPNAWIDLEGVSLYARNSATAGTDGSTCMLAPVNSKVKLSVMGSSLQVDTSTTPATCSGTSTCPEVTLTTTGRPECAWGSWQTCPYGGPAGTAGVGSCQAGIRYCDYRGTWTSCWGETTPQQDVCTNTWDEDCDGTVNDGCPTICADGQTRSCYSGPAGTADVGMCRSGTQTCQANGTVWSFCSGEVQPYYIDFCWDTSTDENCDGQVNEGCPCTYGETRSCYSGATGTQGVGLCRAGVQRCYFDAYGKTFWSATCEGEVLPKPEDCSRPADEDCSGDNAMCGCTPGEKRSCYSGPTGTSGVGLCRAGTQTCNATGNWGTCLGQVIPRPVELCTTSGDDNCDGQSNENPPCVCTPQEKKSCYSGPTGTSGVGACRAGTQSCNTSGTAWETACAAEVLPSYERCDGTDTDCDGQSACTGHWLWSTQFSGQSSETSGEPDTQSASDVAVDGQGNIFLAGVFDTSISLGGTTYISQGNNDIFLVKVDATNTVQWSRTFGDAEDQQVKAITLDSAGRVVVVGSFKGTLDFDGTRLTSTAVDGFVAVLDTSGKAVWSTRFGADTLLEPSAVVVDGAGNILVAGNVTGTFACKTTSSCASAGGQDFFVRSYSSTGAEQWTRIFGGTGTQRATGLAVSGAGELVLAGSFSEAFDFGGKCTALTHAGGDDGFVAKLDATGACVWSQRFGDSSSQQAIAVAVGSAGEIILSGNYQGSVTFKDTLHTSLGGYDIFLVKLDSTGAVSWSRGFGSTLDQTVTDVILEPVGNLVLAGSYQGTFAFGPTSLTQANLLQNMFVAKLNGNASGSHVWSRDFGG